MLARFKTAVEVLREAWLVPRVPSNRKVVEALQALFAVQPAKGFAQYLRDRPARGRQEVVRDWHRDGDTGEARLTYSSSLFSEGCLRIRPGKGNGTLVFLPGNLTAAREVFEPGSRARNMTGVADTAGMALASWDWPLQGDRLDRSLYLGARSLYTAEREYSRFLPALGTSLWREFVAELDFALAHIRRHMGPGEPMHVAGWSMGACFAYTAPLLCSSVGMTIAGGSCARIRDLVAMGETRRHGFWFYPLNCLEYFDLDTVVDEVLAARRRVRIVHGDQDLGCLAPTRALMQEKARASGGLLRVDLLQNHGHVLSPVVKARMNEYLAEAG